MPPKISKLTKYLPQQKKTQVSDKLKTSCDTESLKLETPVPLTSTVESIPIQNESAKQVKEKQSPELELPEMSVKRIRTTRSQLKNFDKEQTLAQTKISDFILKTPQKQQISPIKSKPSRVDLKVVKNFEKKIGDQETQIEKKEVPKAKESENSQVKPIPAYIKYAHLLNKPIHKRYEDDSAIDKVTPPQLVGEGPRTCVSTMPEKNKLPSFLKYKNFVTLREKKALPKAFESLKRNFNALTNIILFNKSKNQIVLFHKIQSSVQMISKQSFTVESLGQLKHLLGDSLICKRVQIVFKGEKVNTWELNLLDSTNETENLWTSEKKFDTKESSVTNTGQYLEFVLKDRLYGIVEEYHRNFLSENNLSVENEFEWHPKFNVENVNTQLPIHTDIGENISILPTNQPKIEEKPSTFDQLMNVAKSSAKRPIDFTPSEAKPKLSIKDRRVALLEKIKAKQADKEKLKESSSSAGISSKKVMMIDQLLNLINSIYLTFQYNNGKPILLEDLSNRLLSTQNCRLDKFEMVDHLKLLSELVPDFCSIESIKNSQLEGRLMRLNLKIELNKVKFALNAFKSG